MTLKNELSINLGLPAAPITQNAELFSELSRVYNAIKSTMRAVDSYTGVINEEEGYWPQLGISKVTFGLNSRIYLEAGEDIDFGQFVGIKSDGKAWLAKDGEVRCIGFCTDTNNAVTGSTTEIQMYGVSPEFPAATFTPGEFYYNSVTAGSIGLITGAPEWRQAVAFAYSDRQLFINPQLDAKEELFIATTVRKYTAAAALSYGQLVTFNGTGGVILAQDGVSLALGYCSTVGGAAIGDPVDVTFYGRYPSFPAATLTPGALYYNSNVAGSIGVKAGAPAYEQVIGFAVSDTTLFFNPQLQLYTPPTLI